MNFEFANVNGVSICIFQDFSIAHALAFIIYVQHRVNLFKVVIFQT